MAKPIRNPLRVNRRSLRKDGDGRLPWVARCGCGVRCQTTTFERGLRWIQYHDCTEWHG